MAALQLGCGTLVAQNISTEVTVKYDERPTLMQVDKLTITPAITLPSLPKASLPLTATEQIQLPNAITTLQPAAWGDTIYTSPYRGYAVLGFMPRFNMGASAGYKVVDNDKTRLNGWLQYDGTYYRGGVANTAVRRNSATLGATLHQAVGTKSFLDAGVDYTFSRYNTPTDMDGTMEMLNQMAHRANLSTLWSLRHNSIAYQLGLKYSYFGYGKALAGAVTEPQDEPEESIAALMHPKAVVAPAREHHVEFHTLFSGGFAGANEAGLELRVNHLTYNDFIPVMDSGAPTDGHTLLSVSPFYRFDINAIHVLAGAKIEATFNCGKAFHIAPIVSVTWLPTQMVKLYVNAGGGEQQNSLGLLYDITPYGTARMNYANSHVPVEAKVGVTVGEWRGLHADISFTYAIANEWLMPEAMEMPSGELVNMFNAIHYKGFRAAIELGYNYRGIVEVTGSVAAAPHKYNSGYYQWRDRAKFVAGLKGRVTPIKPLDITVGWELRSGRHQYVAERAASLGSVNNLTAGALYRINERWSGYLKGENLMNHKSLLIDGVPAQGVTGLVGATYKF